MLEALEKADACFLFFLVSSFRFPFCDAPFPGEAGVVSRLLGMSYISSIASEAAFENAWVDFMPGFIGCIFVLGYSRNGVFSSSSVLRVVWLRDRKNVSASRGSGSAVAHNGRSLSALAMSREMSRISAMDR